jgi:hypothetical protein
VGSLEVELEKLRSAVASFVDFIAKLPAGDLAPAPWGPREVLTHLVFWHETMVSTIEALLAGRTPDLPQGTFAEVNARAVASNRDVPVDRLLERFGAAQSQLERLATLDATRSLAIPVKEGSTLRSIGELITRVEAHIRNHEAKLRRQFSRRG